VLPSQITIDLAQRSEQVFNVTIMATQGPPVGFEIIPPSSELTAKVSGSDAQVKQVAQVVARVNLANETKPITRILPLSAVDAEGNTVPGVDVAPIQVTVDINIQPRPGVTVLNVQPTLLAGSLPQGYLANATVNPASVAVHGDLSAIEKMNGQVATEQIDLSNKVQSFTQTVKLTLPPGVTLTDPVDIVVSVEVDAIPGTRTFANVPVVTKGLDSNDFAITIQPDQVTVIVTGPQSALETLQASDITVIVPLSGLAAGQYTVTLQASVAHAGLISQNLSIPDAKVQVTILALHPTPTPTPSPTAPPTVTPTAVPTGSATP
jgi:YbbR domain-containing protein